MYSNLRPRATVECFKVWEICHPRLLHVVISIPTTASICEPNVSLSKIIVFSLTVDLSDAYLNYP